MTETKPHQSLHGIAYSKIVDNVSYMLDTAAKEENSNPNSDLWNAKRYWLEKAEEAEARNEFGIDAFAEGLFRDPRKLAAATSINPDFVNDTMWYLGEIYAKNMGWDKYITEGSRWCLEKEKVAAVKQLSDFVIQFGHTTFNDNARRIDGRMENALFKALPRKHSVDWFLDIAEPYLDRVIKASKGRAKTKKRIDRQESDLARITDLLHEVSERQKWATRTPEETKKLYRLKRKIKQHIRYMAKCDAGNLMSDIRSLAQSSNSDLNRFAPAEKDKAIGLYGYSSALREITYEAAAVMLGANLPTKIDKIISIDMSDRNVLLNIVSSAAEGDEVNDENTFILSEQFSGSVSDFKTDLVSTAKRNQRKWHDVFSKAAEIGVKVLNEHRDHGFYGDHGISNVNPDEITKPIKAYLEGHYSSTFFAHAVYG